MVAGLQYDAFLISNYRSIQDTPVDLASMHERCEELGRKKTERTKVMYPLG